MELEEILRRKFYREQLERQGGPDFPTLISCDGMTDSEKNDFINFIYGQLIKVSISYSMRQPIKNMAHPSGRKLESHTNARHPEG